MTPPADRSFPELLTTLRWWAIAGQALTIVLASRVLTVPLETVPLWAGVVVLAAFNLWACWRLRRPPHWPGEAVVHVAADITVLTWMVFHSGGLTNPFGSLFLVPIALAALALPVRQVVLVTVLAMVGYAISALLGPPLPHLHHGLAGLFDLHMTGMVANFLITAAVVLAFFARMRAIQRHQAEEIAGLQERFTRNEGILALATHAASVAHELNTPLATLTLMLDECIEDAAPAASDDLKAMRPLLDVCRDRVRNLASVADPQAHPVVALPALIDGWRLLRPDVALRVQHLPDSTLMVEPAVGHLLRALLDNAADASRSNDDHRVHLHLTREDGWLIGTIRDHGAGFDPDRPFLRPRLFDSGKADGLGLGLALSHATVERLGGSLRLLPVDAGACVEFRLPLATPTVVDACAGVDTGAASARPMASP